MRKILFLSVIFMYSSILVYADDIDIIEIRVLYTEAATDENACKEMIKQLSAIDEKAPLLLGYKASGTMMMANYVFSPFSKLSHFKKGKQMLERAVAVDKTNVELRLLRYMTQINAPSFLGYNSNIESDKSFILNNISTMKNMESKDFVIMVLRQSEYLNFQEKRLLN